QTRRPCRAWATASASPSVVLPQRRPQATTLKRAGCPAMARWSSRRWGMGTLLSPFDLLSTCNDAKTRAGGGLPWFGGRGRLAVRLVAARRRRCVVGWAAWPEAIDAPGAWRRVSRAALPAPLARTTVLYLHSTRAVRGVKRREIGRA